MQEDRYDSEISTDAPFVWSSERSTFSGNGLPEAPLWASERSCFSGVSNFNWGSERSDESFDVDVYMQEHSRLHELARSAGSPYMAGGESPLAQISEQKNTRMRPCKGKRERC